MKFPGFVLLLLSLSFFCFAQQRKQTISPTLSSLLSVKKATDSIDVLLSFKDTSSTFTKSMTVLAEYNPSRLALVRLTPGQLETLMEEKKVLFADARRSPKEELTTGAIDISLNKINTSHHHFTAINGDSLFVSVKGQRFDTGDIDLKGRWFNSNIAASTQATHASIMATILAGAGNSSPYAKGAAWGSFLTSSDFSTLLPDPDSIYQKYRISIQNHSYGTGIENYYGGDAAAYDQTVQNQPSLLHVFSAGNVGNTTSTSGPYTGLSGYANLTGSFKMAKNNLVVGATDSFNHVAPLSSKGPAYDGRVKPELVAFGEDGSSGAAALVSGAAALVQQAYKESSSAHALPSLALVKAILLNSADDVERPALDYASGYGALNAYEAVRTVLQNRFWQDSVTQNSEKTFSFPIPANIKLAKVTVSWIDPPALPNAPKALVNDLDAEVLLPATAETWLPWVLNPANHRDSILLPAKRQQDTLNNTEQITLANPSPGEYLIKIKGHKVLSNTPQPFAVAYQFDSANRFEWTYPTASDALKASTTHVVRWQTTFDGSASLSYSLNGQEWQTLSTAVNLRDRYFKWTTPDSTAVGFLRMQVQGQSPFVSDTFTISKTIDLKVGFNCADSVLLYWNNLSIPDYQVYELGEQYLQPVTKVTDTMMLLQKAQHPSLYYSAAPLLQGKPGFRSFTINYTTQGVGCYISSFLATLQSNSALLTVKLGSVYGIRSLRIVRKNGNGAFVVKIIEPATVTTFAVTDADLKTGANQYQLMLTLNNGQVITSPIETVYYLPDQPVIFYPNPAPQQSPIQIVTQAPGEFSIAVYDALGRRVAGRYLDGVIQQLPPLRFSKGLYIVTVTDSRNNRFTQKLVVF